MNGWGERALRREVKRRSQCLVARVRTERPFGVERQPGMLKRSLLERVKRDIGHQLKVNNFLMLD